MRAIMVMYDTLNRHFLPPYGNDWVKAPNFERLAERAVMFTNSYVGSVPTIPTRRELHTGRYNFLHRAWGPVEPFDDSMPLILQKNGVYTHLASDGYHYWEHGGATYHMQYGSWEFSRGQESDAWKGEVRDPEIPETIGGRRRAHWVNRKYMQREEDWCQAKTFKWGVEFIRTNQAEDNWFLQIETFDPHEPYYAPRKYRDLYPHDYDGPLFEWPPYGPVKQTPKEVEHVRYQYAALLSMCDAYLGRVLDVMDELDMWKDTMLVVNTDHGFLLGEHGFLGKCRMPFYNEIALAPLFIWDPRCGRRGETCGSLVQTIDVAPTLLEFFGQEIPKDMMGKPLRETIASDGSVREAALFGQHGGHVNVTDGRHVYMRAPAKPENVPLYNYTLMPTHMRRFLDLKEELPYIDLAGPFSFTKGCKVMRIKSGRWRDWHSFGTLLFDVENDPKQEKPIDEPGVERKMIEHLVRLMKENDCPPEQFERLGLA